MFNDSNSFYYCPSADITNTTQRRHQQLNTGTNGDGDGSRAVTADERFFWNKHMLTELIDFNVCHVVTAHVPGHVLKNTTGFCWLHRLKTRAVPNSRFYYSAE